MPRAALLPQLGHGLAYLSENARCLGLVPFPLPLLALLFWRDSRTIRWTIGAFCLLAIPVLEGGDFLWYGRFFYPALPVLIVTACLGLHALPPFPGRRTFATATFVLWGGMSSETLLNADVIVQSHAVRKKHAQAEASGKALRSVLEADESIAVGPAGQLVYYAEPYRAWDEYGLVVPEIARSRPVAGRPGHQRRAPQLLLKREPDFIITQSQLLREAPCERLSERPALLVRLATDQGFEWVAIQSSEVKGYLVTLASSEARSRPRTTPLKTLASICMGR